MDHTDEKETRKIPLYNPLVDAEEEEEIYQRLTCPEWRLIASMYGHMQQLLYNEQEAQRRKDAEE